MNNSIQHLKCKILGAITPEERKGIGKNHKSLYKKSLDLTKKRHMEKFDEVMSQKRANQSTTNITDHNWHRRSSK